MHAWVATFISVAVVSLISLVGVVTLVFQRERLSRLLLYLVGFAVGGLFGDAFIHLLPEAFEVIPSRLATSLAVVAGILVFFALEKFIRWRHCHADSCGHHHPVVAMNLVGDSIHNFIDGMLIAASYLVSIPVGVATSLAVVLHEIPQEIGDFGIFLHGGCSVRRALAYNFLSALAAGAGAVLVLVIGGELPGLAHLLVPVTAGGFLYIAGSDLIPELKHDASLTTSCWQLVCIVLGVAVMALLVLLEG